MQRHSEYQYLDLLRKLLKTGDTRSDRTGTGTRAIFGYTMRFDLAAGFPVFTTKRIFWKTAFKEMLWMLSGGTNIRELLLQGVRIWTDWPLKRYRETTGEAISQAEFEKRILADEQFAADWGELGPVYGKQWRRWRSYHGEEIDQVQRLIEGLKHDPTSRRLLFEGWNVAELEAMALPPCHKTYQFFVTQGTGKLSGMVFQRSADAYLGLAWNVCNLAFLTHLFAAQCGYKPGEIVWMGGDVHLYLNHIAQAKLQLQRKPRPFPTLAIKRKPNSLFDYTVDDFALVGYDPYPHIAAEVAV
jgi:thymidylate synthase